jgi:hypothetical protein
LLLRRLTIANNGDFDLGGGIFVDHQLVVSCRQKRHSARLPQLERTLRVSGKEYSFETDAVGAISRYDSLKTAVDPTQPFALAISASRSDGSVGDVEKRASDDLNYTPTGHHTSGVYADYLVRNR